MDTEGIASKLRPDGRSSDEFILLLVVWQVSHHRGGLMCRSCRHRIRRESSFGATLWQAARTKTRPLYGYICFSN